MSGGTSRRDFLLRSGGAAAAAVLVPLAGCGGLPLLTGTVVGDRVRVSIRDFDASAGETDAIGVDVGGSYPVLLLRAGDGFRALSSQCTHQACRVDASPEFLVCPCHGSTFDREGKVLRGPAQAPLPAYPVTVKGDTIEIRIG